MIRRLTHYVLILVLILAFPAHLIAQNFGNIAPHTVLGNPDPAAKKPAQPMPIETIAGCVSIAAFGGKGDAVTDNTAALAAALAASPAIQRCVAFPPGKFKFAAPFSYAYPTTDRLASVKFVGAGANVTQLIGPVGGSLFTFTFKDIWNSFHLSDLSLVAASPCATCTALSLVSGYTVPGNGGYGSQNDITHVTITGSDPSNAVPSGANYWETGISVFGISNINFNGITIQGMQTSSGPTPGTSRGVYIYGDATHVPYVFNFTNSIINLYSRAIELGAYFQGATFANGNMVGNTVGFYISAPVGTGAAQLSVLNSQLNSCSHIYVPGGGSPAQLNYLLVSNNLLISIGMPFSCGSYNQAISLGGGDYQNIISNNVFAGASGWTGIFTNASNVVGGPITNNMFGGFGVAVELGGNASGVLVDGNNFSNNTTAIQLDAATQNNVVSNNILSGNTANIQNNTGNTFQNSVDIPQDCSAASYFTFGSGSAGITYSQKHCMVSVVNRQVFVDFDYTFSSKGTSTGEAQLQMGNPAAAASPGGSAAVTLATGMANLSGPIVGDVAAGSSRIDFYLFASSTGSGNMLDTYFTNTSHIKGRASFRAP